MGEAIDAWPRDIRERPVHQFCPQVSAAAAVNPCGQSGGPISRWCVYRRSLPGLFFYALVPSLCAGPPELGRTEARAHATCTACVYLNSGRGLHAHQGGANWGLARPSDRIEEVWGRAGQAAASSWPPHLPPPPLPAAAAAAAKPMAGGAAHMCIRHASPSPPHISVHMVSSLQQAGHCMSLHCPTCLAAHPVHRRRCRALLLFCSAC